MTGTRKPWYRIITISIDKRQLEIVDEILVDQGPFFSRSEFVRFAITRTLQEILGFNTLLHDKREVAEIYRELLKDRRVKEELMKLELLMEEDDYHE